MSQTYDTIGPFTREDIKRQLAARSFLRRRMIGSVVGLFAFLGVYLAVVELVQLPEWLQVLLIPTLFLALIGNLLLMIHIQWSALAAFDLTCPSCRKPLADARTLLRSPSLDCPHCGAMALLTAETLSRRNDV